MTPSHQPLIAAEGLTRSFGSPRTGDWVEVLRGIDVTIPRGTMLAVVGPSGCGKTSLLYCLSGLDRPDGGRLRGFGADMASMPSSKLAELYRTRIGFVFQSSNLVESLRRIAGGFHPGRTRRPRARRRAARQALRRPAAARRPRPGPLSAARGRLRRRTDRRPGLPFLPGRARSPPRIPGGGSERGHGHARHRGGLHGRRRAGDAGRPHQAAAHQSGSRRRSGRRRGGRPECVECAASSP